MSCVFFGVGWLEVMKVTKTISGGFFFCGGGGRWGKVVGFVVFFHGNLRVPPPKATPPKK